MNKMLVFTLLSLLLTSCKVKIPSQSIENIVTTDIDNFWKAYDLITQTEDSLQQANILQSVFLEKGTAGLKSMIEARNYTPDEYLYVINSFPEYWSSIRTDTYKAKTLSDELNLGIKQLKLLYPELTPAKIYFTMGALRSNGTVLDSLVLIGTELIFGNEDTPAHELPDYLSHLRSFFDSRPGDNIVFLNIHEYIHTQQKTTIGDNLLAQTVIEGAAEFLAEKALNIDSPNPMIAYGKQNDLRIKSKFAKEMFSSNVYNWIWNSADNEFGMRDLAYYVGYKICSEYFKNASDKSVAVKEMIQLDYNNKEALIRFVETSKYFDKPLNLYEKEYENSRPRVTSISELGNNDDLVSSSLNTLSIHFSHAMDERYRNFELGPLGLEGLIRIKNVIGFSEDKKTLKLEIEKLDPNKRYQIEVGEGFRNMNGIPLNPYLIEFQTKQE